MTADVLEDVFEEIGKDVDIYMELDGKNVVLIKLVDAMDWGYDRNKILGCKGNWGIKGSVDELTVESKNEVATYRVEYAAGKIVVCNWETGGLNWDKKMS